MVRQTHHKKVAFREENQMYYGWTSNYEKKEMDNKYSLLMRGKRIGTLIKNGTSLPLLNINKQLLTIRNFGKNKISENKLSSLIENKKIVTIGGPCLFSRFSLGIVHNGIFYSLATPEDREKIPWQKNGLELQIGNPITEYHKRHISFMRNSICQIKNATKKEVSIKLIIPCIEYTAYLPRSVSDEIGAEYWEKIKISGEEIKKLYTKELSSLGTLTIIKKQEWNDSRQKDVPRDLKSYTDCYLDQDNNDKLIIAVEDITETPLLINAGRQMKFLIGVLGLLTSLSNLEKEEESHPYLIL